MHISFYTASELDAIRGHPMEHYRTTETHPRFLRSVCAFRLFVWLAACLVLSLLHSTGGHIKAHHAILKMK